MKKPKQPAAAASPGVIRRLRDAVRTVVFGQFRLKRTDGKKLKVTWGETLMAPKAQAQSQAHAKPSTHSAPFVASTRPGVQGRAGHSEAEQMRAELTAALNARPNNRVALPHLAVLEKQLKKLGVQVFERAPPGVLNKAKEQLTLLGNVHTQLLQGALMNALAEEISRRQHDVTVVDDVAWRPPRDSDLMVAEGRMSDFLLVDQAGAKPGSPGKPR